MFLINLNAEIVACILSFRKSRHKPNLENTSKYGFSPDFGGENGGVLNMRMQVILDFSFARPVQPLYGAGRNESSGTGLPETNKIFNNYSPKWRWLAVDIYRAAKRRGKYQPLANDTEVNSYFSIY